MGGDYAATYPSNCPKSSFFDDRYFSQPILVQLFFDTICNFSSTIFCKKCICTVNFRKKVAFVSKVFKGVYFL
jgi:hypothetical protein